MKPSRYLLAALIYALPTAAVACTGVFASGTVCANATAGPSIAASVTVSSLFNRAFGSTANAMLYNNAGTWGLLTSTAGGVINAGATGIPASTVTPVIGVPGTSLGSVGLAGNTSGTVTIKPQAAAGTYNFNLPTSAGTSGQPLLSAGGGASPMTFGTLGPAAGGTGVANNAANTLTWSGAFPATFTLTGSTGVTFPTSGTLATTTSPAASIVVGTTAVTSGTTMGVLFNNAGVLGNTAAGTAGYALIGNGASAPTFQGYLRTDTGTVTRSILNKLGDVYSGADFGIGTADDGPELQAAATAAASHNARVYLPYGAYTSTTVPTGGMFYGDGQITAAANALAGVFSQINTMPTTPASAADMFGGDHSHVHPPEQFIIGSGVARATLTSNYYQFTLIPRVGKANIDAGSSGTAGWITATATAGALSITANASGVVANGQAFILSPGAAEEETRTATTVVGTTINFTPALSNTHTVVAGGPFPEIQTSKRTSSSYDFREMQNSTGGDHYNYIGRINSCSYTPTAGQAHFFFTATCGVIAGEVNAGTDGMYLQHKETLVQDNGFDVAGLGHISNYNRTNATGARGVVWGHDFANSYDERLEWGYNLLGGFKRFIDFSRATLDSDNAALSLPSAARTYYGATATKDVGGFSFYGNVLSDTWFGGTDGGSGNFTFTVNGTGNFSIGVLNNSQVVTNDGSVGHTVRNTNIGTSASASFILGNDVNGALGKLQINSAGNTAAYGGGNSLNLVQVGNNPFTLSTNDTVRLTVSGAGAYRFHTLGAGAMQTDSSGNVSSATLPVALGGTGAATLTGLLQGNGTSAFTAITNSTTVGQILRVTGSNTYAWGALDLADTDAITGDLPFANLTQGSARSVLGVTGNATADFASIQSTQGTLLSGQASSLTFTATPVLGVAGSVVGTIGFQNATSGTVTLSPLTGALGTYTVSLPSVSGTLASLNFANVFLTSQTITQSSTGGVGWSAQNTSNSATANTTNNFGNDLTVQIAYVQANSSANATVGGANSFNFVAVSDANMDFYTNTSSNRRMRINSTRMATTASILAHDGTAIPAGGTAGAGLFMSSTSNFGIMFGSGAPNKAAAKGTLYLRSDGTTTNDRLYVNTDGSTAWTSITTGSWLFKRDLDPRRPANDNVPAFMNLAA